MPRNHIIVGNESGSLRAKLEESGEFNGWRQILSAKGGPASGRRSSG